MPVYDIPETKESEVLKACPSLYSIIQFLLSVTSSGVLVACISTTLWVETFLDSGLSQYRYLSVGLWKVCYYRNMSHPSVATECPIVKFNDFTLVVQVCQCVAVIASLAAVLLSLTKIATKCSTCNTKYNSSIEYNARKYRIVCYLITILGICVSVPVYMCEANVEGVQLSTGIHSTVQRLTEEGNSITKLSPPDLGNLTTISVHNTTTTRSSDVTHYSVFALGLWMQFVVLVLVAIAFVMAVVKHVKKHRELYGEPRLNNRTRARPSLTLELKSRPRSESQRAFFSRQSSSNSMIPSAQEVPVSP